MKMRLLELIMRFRIELIPDSTVHATLGQFHRAFSLENAKRRYEAKRNGAFSIHPDPSCTSGSKEARGVIILKTIEKNTSN